MLVIDWSQIRPVGGSREEGFEELVCQLARAESPINEGFRRKGKPDGGVECFWIADDGKEWAWQAKYFLTSPTASQWRQLDDSVKKLLETHPNVAKLFVAMPIDLPDARLKGQKSALDRWNEHVDKWTSWASTMEKTVEIVYWGSSELLDRLSLVENRGRVFFWFNKESLTKEWFNLRLEESLANAGERYTPKINVNLPIARVFDGLGRTARFYDRLWEFERLLRDQSRLRPIPEGTSDSFKELVEDLKDKITEVLGWFSGLDVENDLFPNPQTLDALLCYALDRLSECQSILSNERKQLEQQKQTQEKEQDGDSDRRDPLRNLSYELHRLWGRLNELMEFVAGEETRCAEAGALLVLGEAGHGKTHLFCDIARMRIDMNLPTVLLLGERFDARDVWDEMLTMLDLRGCSRDEFLGALESEAQTKGRKALILIDALNESADPIRWATQLQGMINLISRYEWINLAISVRSSYVDMVIPSSIDELSMARIEHPGFAGVEYRAASMYFDHYGIELPSTPLLHPEFQSPLFLKILCKGLFNQGLHRIPRGLRGISSIFELFLSSIYRRLKTPDRLDLGPDSQVIENAISRVIARMAEGMTAWLPANEMATLINEGLPDRGYSNSLFYHLQSEGILARDVFYNEEGKPVEGARFPYQRLADHLIVQHLLEEHLKVDANVELPADTRLGKLIDDRDHWWRYGTRGLIEALSVQLPEQTGIELMMTRENLRDDHEIGLAFLQSVLWRDTSAFSQSTLDCMNAAVRYKDIHEELLRILLTLAVIPDHPYNAEFLHQRLVEDTMAVRDSWWSIFITDEYGTGGSVDRLIDWAWEAENKNLIEPEAVRLCSIALAWLLTPSHRFLRDRATKALVALLTNRLGLLRDLLRKFEDVNDPYVSERLYAVAYGCSMRSASDEQLRDLAQDIFNRIFSKGSPPVHILLREYAAGVIEFAVHLGISIKGDLELTKPPHGSPWVEIPDQNEIDSLELPDGSWDTGGAGWAHNWIIFSVMGWDFARYIIGTNSGNTPWLSLRLDEAKWLTPEDQREEFVESLETGKQEAWDEFNAALEELVSKFHRNRYLKLIDTEDANIDTAEIHPPNNEIIDGLQNKVNQCERTFLERLNADELEFYVSTIRPELLPNSRSPRDAPRFDLSMMQRWIVWRVFDLGWTKERFGMFDRFHGQSQREAHKVERIGKKYQWIAYHEILARVADNFQFNVLYSHNADRMTYRGTWQLHVRDIDPSCVLRSTPDSDHQGNAWWVSESYDRWELPEDDSEWLQAADGLVEPSKLIEVSDPADGSKWLNLYSLYTWKQRIPPPADPFSVDERDIFYLLQAYLVHNEDMDNAWQWICDQDFYGRWMPEGRSFYNLFLGEFYWSPAFKYNKDPYEGDYGWRVSTRGGDAEVPVSLLPLRESYETEGSTYDCSIEEGFTIGLATEELATGMGLSWQGVEGCYFNEQGRMVMMDPSVRAPGPSALLIREEDLRNYVSKNSYSVVWSVLGEKNIMGGSIGPHNWKGCLVINGVYRWSGNGIEGNMSTYFIPPDNSAQ